MFGDPPHLAPFFLEAEKTDLPGGCPVAARPRLIFPNNHLQYAITWFLLALGLVVIYAVYVRQALRAPKP